MQETRLAECESFNVELCDCGAVYLTIGFLTLRLNRCAYSESARAIEEALYFPEVREHPTLQ
jgi:hypothetical protein